VNVPFCELCLARIVWAVTANGKHIPLDPGVNPDGNQAAYRDHTETMRTRQLRKDEEPLGFERRYMPHFATCLKRKPAPPSAPVQLPANVIPISRAAARRRPRRLPPRH
jgi:hypothetical protein